jgi:FAD:protein FMN transferase
MSTVTLARDAMATRFELVLHGESEAPLRAAGEEALNEVGRLEEQLSLYRPESEVAQVNARASREPVRVSPELFALLQHAQALSAETEGAFDITLAPLVRCWGFMGGSGSLPDPKAVDQCRARIGMHLVELDPEHRTVRFQRHGVMLDLGAIGKGYAVEKAAGLLREAGVPSALIHGGTSTVYALGRPPEAPCWTVAVDSKNPMLIPLRDEALSVSGIRGKFFEANGRIFGHVLDPRTGWPVTGTALAAVVHPSATETDALSTALLVGGAQEQERLSRLRQGMKSALLLDLGSGWRWETRNLAGSPP